MRRGFRRRCHRIGIWMFGMKLCVLADSSRSSFPPWGRMNFTSPLPGRCLHQLSWCPLKGNYLGSLKHLWSRFSGWHHMDRHKTLNPGVCSVLDESISQTFCSHTNIGSKNPALTPWVAEIQKKSCTQILGTREGFLPSAAGQQCSQKTSHDPCREHGNAQGLLQVFPFAGSLS